MSNILVVDITQGEIMVELTPDKGYILGVVGPGDGYIWVEKSDYRVGLQARDEDFIDEFFNRVSEVYGEPKRHKERAVLYLKKAVDDILKFGELKDFREGSERVPTQVKEASKEVKSYYLRGFFDSQGCVDPRSRRILAVKKNLKVIIEIECLLRDLGIFSHIARHKGSSFVPDGEYYIIRVSWRDELEKYEKLVGFSIKRKLNALKEVLNSYKFRYKRWVNKEEELMREQYNRNTEELAKMLHRSLGGVQQKAARMGLTGDGRD